MTTIDEARRDRLKQGAVQLLRDNDRDGYTIPSPHLYPHQWAWDSGFAAIGWMHVDPARAIREIEHLVDSQWDDGRIPHITFHHLEGDYFPGPEFWETTHSSSLTNPPIWTLALRRIAEAGYADLIDADLVRAVDASHRFFHRERDPEGWGALCVAHPWENGLDNCPAWDRPLANIDVTEAPDFERVDVEKVDDPSERPSDEEYARYATLVKSIAEADFGLGDFAVYDPWLTALVLRAEDALVPLAEAVGVETDADRRADRLRDGLVEHLWDAERGRYRFYDIMAGEAYAPDLLPAYAGLVVGRDLPGRDRMVDRLRTGYDAPFPLPTVIPESEQFAPETYWRGPTWVNTNWLFADSLGESLVDRTLEMVADIGFREYYHPIEGRGLGATDFTWSAALTLDLVARDR